MKKSHIRQDVTHGLGERTGWSELESTTGVINPVRHECTSVFMILMGESESGEEDIA